MGGDIESGGFLDSKSAKPASSLDAARQKTAQAASREPLLSAMLEMSGAEAFAFDSAGKLHCMSSSVSQGRFAPGALLDEIFPKSMAEAIMAAAQEVFASGKGGVLEIEARLGERTLRYEDQMAHFKDLPGTPPLVLVHCREAGAGRLDAARRPTPSSSPNLAVLKSRWLESPLPGKSSRGGIVLRDYEAELKEMEFERDAIGDGVDGVIVERLDKDLQLLWGNREICRISGKSVDDMKGRPCYEAVRRSEAPCEGCTAVKALETESPQEGEITSPDGRSYKSKSLPVKGGDGKVNGVIHVAMDITDWRDLDERMRQAKAKAEELSRVKSEFLACISHEIRTPLNAIVGMAELLKDVAAPDGGEVASCCDEIERASDMLLSILNDIIDYSLLEAGDVKVFAQEFDLREEIASVAEAASKRAKEKGLAFKAETSPEIPERVSGDPRHLRRLLMNLADNAVKFTAKGHVGIKTLLCEAAGREEGTARVRIEVSDSGIGITPEALESVFEPFTQEDSSSKRAHGGTGLGLAIVKKLVSVMHGRLYVESVKGKGSVFSVEIPFHLRQGKESREPKKSKRELSQMPGVKALLLDGSQSASLMKRIFDTLGVDIIHASTKAEALKLLKAGAYDIIFFDSGISEREGMASVAASLKAAAARPLPLVAMAPSASGCGGGDDAERELCRKAGIDAILSKPPRRSQIASALRSHCKAAAQ